MSPPCGGNSDLRSLVAEISDPVLLQFPLCDRVLLRDVSALRFHDQFELVRLEQGIIAELEREVRCLLQFLREVTLLLENVHRDVGMQLHQQIVSPALDGHGGDIALRGAARNAFAQIVDGRKHAYLLPGQEFLQIDDRELADTTGGRNQISSTRRDERGIG